MGQLSIDYDASASSRSSPGRRRSGMSHREQAEAWAAAHPDAWRLLRHLALKMARANSKPSAKGSGARRIGMKQVVEEARWNHTFSRTLGDFKINNNHTSHLARMLIEKHPELKDLIELRKVRG